MLGATTANGNAGTGDTYRTTRRYVPVPTRAHMRLDVIVVVGVLMTATLLRLWAARHATHDDWTQIPADAIQVAL